VGITETLPRFGEQLAGWFTTYTTWLSDTNPIEIASATAKDGIKSPNERLEAVFLYSYSKS